MPYKIQDIIIKIKKQICTDLLTIMPRSISIDTDSNDTYRLIDQPSVKFLQ